MGLKRPIRSRFVPKDGGRAWHIGVDESSTADVTIRIWPHRTTDAKECSIEVSVVGGVVLLKRIE